MVQFKIYFKISKHLKNNSKLNWKAKESSENNANYVTLTGQVDIIHGMMPEIISAVIN